MALSFAILIFEPSSRLRGPITGMLEAIEEHLTSPEFVLSGVVPSPSLLMAVLDIAELDRTCVGSRLISLLNRLVSGADYGQTGSRVSIDATVASTRAVGHLKERYAGLQQRPPMPTRKPAIRPVDNLRDLNLRLPSNEQPQASSSMPTSSSPIVTRSPRPQ